MSGPPAELVFQELSAFVYDEAPRCVDCTRVQTPAAASIDAEALRRLKFDVVRTFDGAIVVTGAFRSACVGIPGIDFVPLLGGDDHWVVEVDCIVHIERFQSHVRAGTNCVTCSRPRYVTRSGPLRLVPGEPLPTGFSRTDVEFGDTADFGQDHPIRMQPAILVDRETARTLKAADLLGIHLITQP